MEWNLKLTGLLLVLVSLMHIGFSARFNWKQELAQLTLINRQMMIVHTFFVAFAMFLMGLLCLFYPAQLTQTRFGRIVSGGLFVFWLLRLICQFFVYSPALWKGKRFETRMHWLFAGIWTYVTIVFFTAAFGWKGLPFGTRAATRSLPSSQQSRPYQGKPQTIPHTAS